jgi:zinc/manganese transport system substrate-binding protein/manganese/iron transport system substrate-binding protein
MRRKARWGGLMALLLALAACDGAPSATPPTGSGAGRLNVVATTTQIRSMAEAVAGDRATVRSILPPGVDAHEFEPKPSDVQAVSAAALVLKNGIGLDDWLDRLLINAGGNHALTTVSDGVPIRQGDEQETAGDPHIWFSALNAMTMTRNIRDALVAVDAAHAATYQANADAYLSRLAGLDQYIMDQIATVPPDQRKMVTNHDGFGYYIARYGLTFVGSIIPSLSSEAQPSARDVADLITKVKAAHVKAIFLESSINPQLAQQIGDETGVTVVDTLYGDALGAPGTPGATYEGMMRYNTDTIVAALK